MSPSRYLRILSEGFSSPSTGGKIADCALGGGGAPRPSPFPDNGIPKYALREPVSRKGARHSSLHVQRWSFHSSCKDRTAIPGSCVGRRLCPGLGLLLVPLGLDLTLAPVDLLGFVLVPPGENGAVTKKLNTASRLVNPGRFSQYSLMALMRDLRIHAPDHGMEFSMESVCRNTWD